MNTKDLLRETEHRPWPLPNDNWQYYQEWNEALFLHWQVDDKILREFVPVELEIDRYDAKSWVSIVAFSMANVRPSWLPAFAPISNFDEVNIRTYVKYKGKQGVYFLSIEGGKRLSCYMAKKISRLPYRFSKMKRSRGSFESRNQSKNESIKIRFRISNTSPKEDLTNRWLTERYALFQDFKGRINAFEIHHERWPLQSITIEELHCKYTRFKNLINGPPNRVHYSPGVHVVAWN